VELVTRSVSALRAGIRCFASPGFYNGRPGCTVRRPSGASQTRYLMVDQMDRKMADDDWGSGFGINVVASMERLG